MECIVEEYIKFTTNFFFDYYKTLLNKSYDKKIIEPFITKYISVRYYNESVYNEKNFVEKINKELHNIATTLISETEDENFIKNIYALFTYLLYLDNCYEYSNPQTLIKTLFEDTNIKITYDDETKANFKQLVNNYLNQKEQFLNTFNIKEFKVRETKISNTVYEADLDYSFEVNKLYSEYAINAAYNSDVVVENRLYLLLLILSKNLIELITKLDYKKTYVVDMPFSLLQKPKKQKRFLRVLDNNITKNRISLKIKYQDYSTNREQINQLISDGYSFSLELDSSFIDDVNCLVLFDNIFVYKKENYYDIINNSKNSISSNVIII